MASENQQPLQGRVALVTGGSRGIGLTIAQALAEDGCRIAIGARSEESLKQAAGQIQGAEVLTAGLDVTSPEQVDAAVRHVVARWGRIDILVNNAGVVHSAPLLKLDLENWQRTIAVNLTGVYLCTRAVLGGMIERRQGRIINIASVASKAGAPYISAYAASKHGVLGFTKCVAQEVAQQGITVNAVCPGYVAGTDMTESGIARMAGMTGRPADDIRKILEQHNPQKRLVEPREVAFIVRMLARDDAAAITGQAINIDGGMLPY